MARLTFLHIFLSLSTGLVALVGCGGGGESDPTSPVSIDTSPLRTQDDVAQAAAAEHGAPGENEKVRYVLVGENASEGLVELLRERGFADVGVGAR